MTELTQSTIDMRLEALLFVADEPVHVAALAEALHLEESQVKVGIDTLRRRLEHSGLMLAEVGGGFRLESRPEMADDIREFLKESRKSRLSLAALETLALIAYKQPITAVEVAESRMVTSVGSIIKSLLDKKLIRMAGRRKVIGRPMMYATTREFLVQFGLNELSELPSLEEFKKQIAEQTELEFDPGEEEVVET